MSKKTGIDRAITAAGSVTKLSSLTGHSHQVIQQWRAVGRVPAEHCPKFERLTGIRCEALNPAVEWKVLRGVE